MIVDVDSPVSDLAEVVADLARAVSTALDPTTILDRTLEALGGTVPVAAASLWSPEGVLLAPPGVTEPPTSPGTAVVELRGVDRTVGVLRAVPVTPSGFDARQRALLEIAASQIAGALERTRLFQEVMELERLKSDFIARVSHELRTPITIINGFLETLLAHDRDLDAEQRLHMLERSQMASARLSGLIEELLLLSRLDAGVLTPDPHEVSLGDVLAAVRATSAGPDQVLVAAPADARLRTDGALLERALGLVVDNAIKYGGTAEVTAEDQGDGWAIEVRDRGAGFPDDVRDIAFEMFTRSKEATVPGLGVGLPIARTLVEVLDGTIAIVDHPGTGAVVRIDLPRS